MAAATRLVRATSESICRIGCPSTVTTHPPRFLEDERGRQEALGRQPAAHVDVHVQRACGHQRDRQRGAAICSDRACTPEESPHSRCRVEVVELTRQKRRPERSHARHTDAMGLAVRPVATTCDERQGLAELAHHGPGDAVWLEGSIHRQHGDAHSRQGEATSPVVRPVHGVHDEPIDRGIRTKSHLAGFL